MYATRNLHDKVITVGVGMTPDLGPDTASFDPSHDLFHEDTETGNQLRLRFGCCTAFGLSGLCLRLRRRDVRRFTPLAARLVQEDTARWTRVSFCLTHAFVVATSRLSTAEVADQTGFKSKNAVVFHWVVFLVLTQ
jgi:hypothetical protein